MDEQMLRRIPALKHLPILDEADEEALELTHRSVCELAETDDPVRVYDILHRAEYKPLAAIRGEAGIRVYFEMRNHAGVNASS
jgi:hypothetical protein